MHELRYDGRVAIVTGAGRGIGRGHALLLGAKGARVVVADYGGAVDGQVGSSSSPADDVVAEIRANGGEAVACCASVAEESGAAAIVTTALDEFRRLDVVVNNAGIFDDGLFGDLTVEQFRRMIDVHYYGTLFVIRAAWPHLVDAGYGRIVNTSSESILGGNEGLTSYSAAKGAVFGLTKNLATEGARHGIQVNAVTPRAFTRMYDANSMLSAQPSEVIEEAKRIMAPEFNAPVVAFLAHESCPLNGEVLQGGMGTVSRIAVVHTNGLTKDGITAEDIAENLDAILDIKGAIVTDLLGPEVTSEHI